MPGSTATRATQAEFVTHAAPDDEDDDGSLKVRGIALGEGLARGTTEDDGPPSYYSPEVLEAAADDLVGKKLVDDTNHDDLESKHPPNDAIVGEVTDVR